MTVAGLRTRLLKGIGANLYGQVIVAIIQLASVPILLHCWGVRTYGQWLLLTAVPSYLSMTDLGFSISAANDMTAQVAQGNRSGALAVFHSITALIVASCAVMLGLIAAALWFTPACRQLHLGLASPAALRAVLMLLCCDVLAKLFDGVNHAGFRANGEYALHSMISNTTPLLQQLALWSVAICGYGPLPAVCAYLVIRLAVISATAVLLTRRHQWLTFGVSQMRLAELVRLSRPALANLAMPAAQSLNIQGMVIAVGIALGPRAVVTFTTTRTLTRIVLQAIAAISHSAEPEFAILAGLREHARIATLYIQTMRFSLWLSLGTSCLLAATITPFMRLWTHGMVTLNTALFIPLLLTVLSSSIWNQALAILKAANQHLTAALYLVLTNAAAVALTFEILMLSRHLAFAGMVLLGADLTFSLIVLQNCARQFGFRVLDVFAQALNPLPLYALIGRRRSLA